MVNSANPKAFAPPPMAGFAEFSVGPAEGRTLVAQPKR
jgi:hypothetical protein